MNMNLGTPGGSTFVGEMWELQNHGSGFVDSMNLLETGNFVSKLLMFRLKEEGSRVHL